jgi:hypothetical protein
MGSPKIVAFEGEFAMCAGHAQELKTQASRCRRARLRLFFSDNNAGIDDALLGGVVHEVRRLPIGDQWTSRMERVLHTGRPRLREILAS